MVYELYTPERFKIFVKTIWNDIEIGQNMIVENGLHSNICRYQENGTPHLMVHHVFARVTHQTGIPKDERTAMMTPLFELDVKSTVTWGCPFPHGGTPSHYPSHGWQWLSIEPYMVPGVPPWRNGNLRINIEIWYRRHRNPQGDAWKHGAMVVFTKMTGCALQGLQQFGHRWDNSKKCAKNRCGLPNHNGNHSVRPEVISRSVVSSSSNLAPEDLLQKRYNYKILTKSSGIEGIRSVCTLRLPCEGTVLSPQYDMEKWDLLWI